MDNTFAFLTCVNTEVTYDRDSFINGGTFNMIPKLDPGSYVIMFMIREP